MPRQLRIEYPGAVYHVMARGDRREDIFVTDVDRQDMIKTLAETCAKTGWQIHAYCLMRNHFHLVVESPDANLVAGMHWFLSTYTIRLNKRSNLSGHVFSGRYKAIPVESSGNGYLRNACDYVHLNPVRANLIKAEERLVAYPWSSLGWYLSAPEYRPSWIRVDRLLGEHGIPHDSAAASQEFERQMQRRRLEETDETALNSLRRAWFHGSESFRKELLEKVEASGEPHTGAMRLETARDQSERIIAEELQRIGWSESELAIRRKSDPAKLAIAARLRKETTLTLKAIAERLHLGTSKSANARLHKWMRPPSSITKTAQPQLGI